MSAEYIPLPTYCLLIICFGAPGAELYSSFISTDLASSHTVPLITLCNFGVPITSKAPNWLNSEPLFLSVAVCSTDITIPVL